MKYNVLIWENCNKVESIIDNLFCSFKNWRYFFCKSFKDFNNKIIQEPISLVIISDEIENRNSLNICRYAKQINHSIGIIILTNFNHFEFEKKAYEIGVDDIIHKPFIPGTFFLKCINLFKRCKENDSFLSDSYSAPKYIPLFENKFIHVGDTIIDFESGIVTKKGLKVANLGSKEAKLLSFLYNRNKDTVTHEEIKELIFHDITTSRSTITTMIKRIRRKLKPTNKIRIINNHSKGYTLVISNSKSL